jgi:16S rRNA (cytosine1402-N4)-methyltransferase
VGVVEAVHTPVLLEEVIEWLRIRPDGTYVDATVGLGGHAVEIAKRLTTGRLIAMDRDAQALELARKRLSEFGERVTLVHARFSRIDEVMREQGASADGVLADLGVSSLQLDSPERGFSFRFVGPLDMRMDSTDARTADEIVNTWPEKELADVIYRYGEERNSRKIARAIVRSRPIRDTEHLATVVAGVNQPWGRQKLQHAATLTFLALRTAVNGESEELERLLEKTPATLNSGGRWVVLTYHSLEDRLVKHAFRELARRGVLRVLTKKVLRPTAAEVQRNPRARSAKLRAAERLPLGPRAESSVAHA